MSKEMVRTAEREQTSLAKIPLILVCAMILSSAASLFGRISPFTAAFIGSLMGTDCLLAIAGSAIGFMIRGSFIECLPTLSTMVMVVLARIVVGKSDSTSVRIGISILTGISVLVTNLITAQNVSDIIIAVVFGVVAFVSCISLMMIYRGIRNEKTKAFLKPANAAAGAIVYIFGAASICYVEIGVVNAGMIAAALITLCAGHKFGLSGAAVMGAAASAAFAIAGKEFLPAGVIVLCGGIVSCVLREKGKLPQTALFILTSGIMLAVVGVEEVSLKMVMAALAGGILYMLIPIDRITSKIERVPSKTSAETAELIGEKLNAAGEVMAKMRLAVDKTAQTLDKGTIRDISWVYNTACDIVCKRCRHNMRCWGEEYNQSIEQMDKMMKILRRNITLTDEMIGGLMAARCTKKNELIRTLNVKYREYTGAELSRRKTEEMRKVLMSQLSAAEKLLLGMSEEIKSDTVYDRQSAVAVERTLESLGIKEAKAVAAITNGNMYIEAFGKGVPSLGEEALCDKLIEALQREFDLPTVTVSGDEFHLSMFERALYSTETAVSQLTKGREKACGDYFDCFTDGKGNFYAILSDGMGSGNRARIDSAFACGMLTQLLKAGVRLEAAIDILNASLLVKSSDESFATLDICRIDLYTGRAEIYKAGGADTFIKCGKKVYKINTDGVPVGIDFEPSLIKQSITVGDEDIIFLTSDGAEITENWLEGTLKNKPVYDLRELAELIAQTAKYNCEKGREDDITVAAIRVIK